MEDEVIFVPVSKKIIFLIIGIPKNINFTMIAGNKELRVDKSFTEVWN